MINDLSAYAFPWNVMRNDDIDAWAIVDANGEEVLYYSEGGEHGCRAEINLTASMAEKLCALVNAGMIKP